jgi:O-antigen ligase
VQPRQAHNDYLQLAVEGGLLLTIPALLLIAAVGRAIVRALRVPQDERTWWIRMGAVAGIIGIAVQEISEFSLQIPAVSLLFVTCVAIAIHEADDRASARKLNRRSQRHAEAA